MTLFFFCQIVFLFSILTISSLTPCVTSFNSYFCYEEEFKMNFSHHSLKIRESKEFRILILISIWNSLIQKYNVLFYRYLTKKFVKWKFFSSKLSKKFVKSKFFLFFSASCFLFFSIFFSFSITFFKEFSLVCLMC